MATKSSPEPASDRAAEESLDDLNARAAAAGAAATTAEARGSSSSSGGLVDVTTADTPS